MYLQGTAIWHPRCGPGPSENGTTIFNGAAPGDVDRISNSAMSEIQVCVINHFFSPIEYFILSTQTEMPFFMIGHNLSPFCSSYQIFLCLKDFIFIFVIYDLYPQFSLRSRTPSISGSVCDPYTGRRVSYYYLFLLSSYTVHIVSIT